MSPAKRRGDPGKTTGARSTPEPDVQITDRKSSLTVSQSPHIATAVLLVGRAESNIFVH